VKLYESISSFIFYNAFNYSLVYLPDFKLASNSFLFDVILTTSSNALNSPAVLPAFLVVFLIVFLIIFYLLFNSFSMVDIASSYSGLIDPSGIYLFVF